MKIVPKNQPEPENRDYAKEIAEKTSEPKLSPDYMEQYSAESVFESTEPPKSDDSNATETSEENPPSKGGYRVTDSSRGRDPEVVSGEGEVSEQHRDLDSYEGGTDLVKGSWYEFRRNAVTEDSSEFGTFIQRVQLQRFGVEGRIFYTGEASAEDVTLKGGVGAEGKVELYGLYEELEYKTPSLNLAGHDIGLGVGLNVDVVIGARALAVADASIGKDTYLEVRGELFAGVSYSMEGEAEVTEYADAHGEVEWYVGVGAKGGFMLGFEDDQIKIDVETGLAVGYGLGFDVGINIDVVEIGKTVYDVGSRPESVNEALDDVYDASTKAFQSFVETIVGSASSATDSSGAEDFIESAEETVEETGEAVEEFVEEVSEDAEEAAETVTNAIEDAADW